MLTSIAHLLEVFFTKLTFNLKSEASKTYLSYVWWVMEPAFLVAIFYFVFANFLARGADNFLVFLVCGHIPFSWFSKSVTNASNSILDGRYLINQIAIPKPVFPMLAVFQDAVKQVVVFAVMFLFLATFGMEISWSWLNVIFVIIAQLMLISAASLVVAAVTPFLPDFNYLIATAMIALMFGSGIFYDYADVIPPEHQRLFMMNPVANLITNYRQVLMDNMAPDWTALGVIFLGSTIVIALMVVFYRRFGTSYARLILQ
jgi:lipopolysaccharide transport system permease protein